MNGVYDEVEYNPEEEGEETPGPSENAINQTFQTIYEKPKPLNSDTALEKEAL